MAKQRLLKAWLSVMPVKRLKVWGGESKTAKQFARESVGDESEERSRNALQLYGRTAQAG